MSDQPLVQILLSSYNGEKYLEVQLDSILAQTWPNIEVLVRDDGSSDATCDILRRYEEKYSNIHVLYEENIGYRKSFFKLMDLSTAPYVALMDQDDYWEKDKVEVALRRIQATVEEGGERPILYFSHKNLVDQNLKAFEDQDRSPLKPGFGNAVIENICTGCTILMNRSLMDKICIHLPEHDIYHDWWCYLVATYYGEAIFDVVPHILYRQHGNNQVGASDTFFGVIVAKKKELAKRHGLLKAQLEEFHAYHHEIPEKDALVEEILAAEHGFGNRWKAAFSKKYWRQTGMDTLIVRGLFLINRML